MKVKIFESFLKGIAFAIGVGVTAAVAVTVSGTFNSFQSGETISASTINQNFSALKTAIEGVDPQYSTSEVATHKTWIDGKTIYRKVVYIPALPNTTVLNQAHGASVSQLTHLSGFSFVGTAYYSLSLPQPADQILLTATTTNIQITTYSDRSSMSAYVLMEYTK